MTNKKLIKNSIKECFEYLKEYECPFSYFEARFVFNIYNPLICQMDKKYNIYKNLKSGNK